MSGLLGFAPLPPPQGDNALAEANSLFYEATKRLWESVGNSGVYQGVIAVAQLFMAIGIGFIAYRLFKIISEDRAVNYQSLFGHLIWPIVVVSLFFQLPGGSSPGATQIVTNRVVIWQVSVALRNLIHHTETQLIGNLARALPNQGGDQALEQFTLQENQYQKVARDLKKCESIKRIIDHIQCLRQVAQDTEQSAGNLGSQPLQRQAGEFKQQAEQAILTLSQDLTVDSENLPGEINQLFRHPFLQLQDRTIPTYVTPLLGAISVGFSVILELSLLLVAIVAPLAFALSLVPLQTNTVVTWISGIMAVGMTKISYLLLVYLSVFYPTWLGEALPGDVVPDWIRNGIWVVIAVLAPFIAGSVGAFSAAGIQQGLTQMALLVGSGGLGSIVLARRFLPFLR